MSFSAEPIPVRRGVVWDIAGQELTGKTDFLCKAPGRIAYVDIDGNSDQVVKKHQFDAAGRVRIEYASYEREMPAGLFAPVQLGVADEAAQHNAVREASRPLMLKIFADIVNAAKSGRYRSIDVDTQDELWQTIRMAHFGRLAKVPGHLYDKANADFRYMIAAVKNAGVNLILASKVEDEWITTTDERGNDKRTTSGRKKRSGTDKVGYLMDAYFESRRIDKKGQPPVFELELKKSTSAPWAVGTVWRDAEIKFADIAAMLYPEVAPENWEDKL